MGETVEGLAILARIPERGRDDDGMEYGPHVVAAIRGEALASLGRFGEAADVVLDAVRSAGVLEADVGELVRWLLQAERSPAEITAALTPRTSSRCWAGCSASRRLWQTSCWTAPGPASRSVSSPWRRRPVWPLVFRWHGLWSGRPGCDNGGWQRRARW